MSTVKRVGAEEARRLIEIEGHAYVDVRTVEEFDAGHPEGAYNVPIALSGPMGMQPNGDFVAVMERTFAKDARIVVGCKMGGRSLRAAEALVAAGFSNVVDQRAGFDGARDPFGRLTEPGWRPAGLPVATKAADGRSWAELRTKK